MSSPIGTVLPPRWFETLRQPEPLIVDISGLTFIPVPIPEGKIEIQGILYNLKMSLVVEIRKEGADFIAIRHDVEEYGMGVSVEAAREDLLSSLVDYMAFLEKRADRLADKPKRHLELLKKLLERL